MAYISTSHSVGDIVFAYDEDTDSVQRLRVVSMRAFTNTAATYSTGSDWTVGYVCRPAQANDDGAILPREFSEDELHSSASNAFPRIAPVAAPAVEVTEHDEVPA